MGASTVVQAGSGIGNPARRVGGQRLCAALLGPALWQDRQANLQALCLRATAFDGSGDSLADFLRQNGHGAKHSRRGDTPTLTERDDVVRIMSVHKSKGLEFPIVIGCGLGRRFNQDNERDEDTGARSDLYLDDKLGLGLGFFDPKEPG